MNHLRILASIIVFPALVSPLALTFVRAQSPCELDPEVCTDDPSDDPSEPEPADPDADPADEVGGFMKLENPIKSTSISGFLDDGLQVALTIAVPVIMIMIIYTGFLFVKAQGDPAELTKAKKAFTYTVVGAGIIMGATLVSTVIQGTIDNVRGA